MQIRRSWNDQLRKHRDDKDMIKMMNEDQLRQAMLRETAEELECCRTIKDLYWHYANQHHFKVHLDILKDLHRTEPQ